MAKIKSKSVQSKVKKMHPAYIIIVVISLVVGLAAGYFIGSFMYGKDTLKLNGDKTTYVTAGESVSYEDEGVKYVSNGKDMSSKVSIKTNMVLVDGKYVGTPTEDEELYIIYEITAGRAKGETLYRVFKVNAAAQGGGEA